jgi:glutathione S-transferase
MDTHLEKSASGYLVGDRCTIADISCWGWVASASTFHPLHMSNR